MASPLLSPRVILLCGLLVLICCYLHESEAWRRRGFRFRGRRIITAVRRVLPSRSTLRQVLPRLRIGSGRLRRFRLPSLRVSWPILKHPSASSETSESDGDTVTDECTTLTILTRQQWNAPTLSHRSALKLPVQRIALYNGGKACTTLTTCSDQSKAFYQESYSYNFMIGGDGNVYEGRGWNIQSDHQVLPNKKATEYGFLLMRPDCPDDNDTMWEKFSDLICQGVKLQKLAADFNVTTDIIWSRLEC